MMPLAVFASRGFSPQVEVFPRKILLRLALLSKQLDGDAQAIFAAYRCAVEQALAEGGDKLTREKRAALDKKLNSVDARLLEQGIHIADHGDEVLIWRTAEVLARLLDVPLLCHSGARFAVSWQGPTDRQCAGG